MADFVLWPRILFSCQLMSLYRFYIYICCIVLLCLRLEVPHCYLLFWPYAIVEMCSFCRTSIPAAF